MDQEDIHPGERWQASIERAIEQSDFFLACLSTYAVSRQGFLQRELQTALDHWQEQVHSEIYLIPVRLEPCEVPDVLRDVQWVNLYEERGWPRLLRALQFALERRAAMTASGVRKSSLLITPATPEKPPAHAEGTTPPTAPARTSTGMDAEVRRQLERMRSSRLGARERVAAGNALAQHGDPRFLAEAWYLLDDPLLGFVETPAGPFLMGSDQAHDRAAFDDEFPQHEVVLPRYFIGRYPATMAQFRAFVEDSGNRPEDEDCLQGVPTHPVVHITWYEALKYCGWLTERLPAWAATADPLASLLRRQGWEMTLLSEAEWEKAARSTITSGAYGVPVATGAFRAAGAGSSAFASWCVHAVELWTLTLWSLGGVQRGSPLWLFVAPLKWN